MSKMGWLCLLLVLAIVPAQAQITGFDPRYIDIDGNVTADDGTCVPPGSPCIDWMTKYDDGTLVGIIDGIGNADGDILSPDSNLKPGSMLPKQDITRIWLSNNTQYLYVAEERRANNGNSAYHLFMTKQEPTAIQGQPVVYHLENGDLEIQICFPKGSDPGGAFIEARQVTGLSGTLDVLAEDIWASGAFQPSGAMVAFQINTAVVPAVPGALDSKGNPTSSYDIACFAEAAISLAGLGIDPCSGTAWASVITRSSCSLTSDVKDFAGPVGYNFGGPVGQPIISSTDCDGITSLSATVSGGTCPYTFVWKDGGTEFRTATPTCDAVTNSATDSFIWPFAPGDHYVTVEITDGSGCPCVVGADLITVYELLGLALTKPITPDCSNGATLSATADGGKPPYRFQWYEDGISIRDVTLELGQVTDTFSRTFTPGNHTISVHLTDARTDLACSADDSYGPFPVYELLTVDLQPISPDCENKADLSATAGGGKTPYTFKWYDKDVLFATHQPGGATDTIDDYVFTPGDHTIKVVVTDDRTSLNCSKEDAEGPFTVYELLDVTLTHSVPTCDGVLTWTANPSGGNGSYSYVWKIDGALVNGDNPTLPYGPNADCQTYEVSVTVTDSRTLGCSDSDKENVHQEVTTTFPP